MVYKKNQKYSQAKRIMTAIHIVVYPNLPNLFLLRMRTDNEISTIAKI
jgi:hypothetical protein